MYINNDGYPVAPAKDFQMDEIGIGLFEEWKEDHPHAMIVDIKYAIRQCASLILIIYVEDRRK